MIHPLKTAGWLLGTSAFTAAAAAQDTKDLHGRITDINGSPIPEVHIREVHTHSHAVSDTNGFFIITVPLQDKRYKFVLSNPSFKDVTCYADAADTALHCVISGMQATDTIQEVSVVARTPIEEVRQSPFNVVALDAKSTYNSTMTLSDLLDKASGVKVRQDGGLGSGTSVSLNGFTGKYVKIFMDGVPMDGFGSAFQLNNIPVNIADRIEIYKGVVPIEFGADAIGGVINIVTNQSAQTFVDASLSYGSFNTQKGNLSLGRTTKSGFSVQLNAFVNRSDNNYKVKAKVLSLNGLNYSSPQWVRRFHDKYENETAMLKVGFVKKWWADRFYLGLTVGAEKADVQNGYTMDFVYGQRRRTASTILPSLQYEKNNFLLKGLHLRLTSNYNHNENRNIDTATMRYNWLGERIYDPIQGEAGTATLSRYLNRNASSTLNLSYRINDKHSLSINDVISGYSRKIDSDVPLTDLDSPADTMKRSSWKNVLGASYRYRHNDHWNFNLFAKNYYQSATGPYDTSVRKTNAYISRTNSYSITGYGLAATYLFREFQFKSSIEKAYRLPTETELFGDEVLTTSNTTLKAENSLNYNLGVTMNKSVGDGNLIYVDINGYFRYIKDFIKQEASQTTGTVGSINFGKARNIGVDAEARYYYKNIFMIGGTVTYQDLRSREPYQTAFGIAKDGHFNQRMPNVPYFFGNADASYYVHHFLGKGNVLSLNYTFNFVGKFYLLWADDGSKSTKATLPNQLYHDFTASYMIKNGRYNIAFEALNFTNTSLFDNFNLQKPGRSLNVKLRYYFSKRN